MGLALAVAILLFGGPFIDPRSGPPLEHPWFSGKEFISYKEYFNYTRPIFCQFLMYICSVMVISMTLLLILDQVCDLIDIVATKLNKPMYTIFGVLGYFVIGPILFIVGTFWEDIQNFFR